MAAVRAACKTPPVVNVVRRANEVAMRPAEIAHDD
jgi:hypothetical protein